VKQKRLIFLTISLLTLLTVASLSVVLIVKSAGLKNTLAIDKVNRVPLSKPTVGKQSVEIKKSAESTSPVSKNNNTKNLQEAIIETKASTPKTSPISLASIDMPSDKCSKDAPVRNFNISAIQVDMVYNKFGDHDPTAKIYALKEDVEKIKNEIAANPGKPVKEIQPLTIRANKGDCIQVTFSNNLAEKASIHIEGVGYEVQGADGTAVGYNPDSTASPNTEIQYRWNTGEEGTFFFYNGADFTYFTDPTGEKGTMGNGLFGALIVEPKDAKWTDPITGEELKSGLYANIELPNQPDYREYTLFFHDGISALNGNGQPDPNGEEDEAEKPHEEEGEEPHEEGGEEPHEEAPHEEDGNEKELYAVNYRAEPLDERMENALGEDGKDPTMFYSSWVFGDPATPITRAYVGDPIKFRVIGANNDENHVFHLHGHRWKSDTKKTNTVDSDTLNIGDTQTAELAFGAGYDKNETGAPGDYLWHCHLFPHYLQGMWGLLRVYDKAQPDLLPLKDREIPPGQTEQNPGFPNYIPGEIGKRAPKPPDPELRPATDEEKAALGALVPGAPNFDRCPKDAPTRKYDIVGIQKDIVYNNQGDHDKEGRMFVLKEDEQKVVNGEIRPRPLVIRANQGDCVEVTLENHLFNVEEPNALSIHIHFVAYDPLGSDGTAVGWNYNQGTEPGEKIRYRWYADEEGSIFFHDHMSAGEKGFHGTFGTLIVEPTGSKWLDPKTGKELKSGTEAMIVHPDKEDFREQVMIYHDFARLWDKNGQMLPLESDPADTNHAHGYAAVNYSNAPFFRRNNADPAYVFSSWVHGDPQTPIIESYPGDPIKVRLIQGAHETQHNFNLHGLSWKRESGQKDSELTSTQTIGMSEQFTMDIQPNPVGIRQRDYLWSSQPIEDLWSGLWGFVRVWGEKTDRLLKLPDRPQVKTGVDPAKLVQMKQKGSPPRKAPSPGNPCPPGAPVRKFDVTAFLKDLVYNKYGDHDPFGMMFSLTKDYQLIKDGKKAAEPLVIRANEGECIQVTLTNNLPADPPENVNDPALLMANQVNWKNSNRVSLHPQMVQYDMQGSDGATIGYNYDQTIGPGEKITYQWYADKEYGGTILYDYGDIRSHRLHGAFGALIIEPKGSVYRNPTTGREITSGARADIIVPDKPDFREQVLLFSDGLYTIGKDGSAPTPGVEDLDMEDRGEKGINYSSEPFKNRLATNPDKSQIFSSIVHGDPSTPMPEAYVGDPIRLRVMHTADRSRGSVFTLHSHRWRYQWTDPNSKLVSSQGSITPGETLDIIPVQPDGLLNGVGDYLYREMKLRRYLEGGLWGILRIHNQPKNQLLTLPDRRPETPVNIRVSNSANRQQINMEWDAKENKDIVGFNVYRKAILQQRYEKVNPEVIKSLSYSMVTNPMSQLYYYTVTAVDKYGNESLNSEEKRAHSGNIRTRLTPF
jgi:manganese oxidase